jgi:signal transduction histidine kinase
VQSRRVARREQDIRAIRDLAQLTSRKPDSRQDVGEVARELLDADAVVQFCVSDGELLSTVMSGADLPALRVGVDDPTSAVARAYREQQTVFANRGTLLDTPPLRGVSARAVLAVPVTRGQSNLGVMLWIWRRRRWHLSARDRTVAEMLAAEKGIVIERSQMFREVEQLTRSQVRTRLARDLHDSVAQELAILSTYAHTATTALQENPDVLRDVLPIIQARADKANDEMRELLDALRVDRPLVELTLAEIIDALVADFRDRCPVEVSVERPTRDTFRLRRGVRETVYFVLREALHNAARHSHAAHVRVVLQVDDDCLTLTVEDDGSGFDIARTEPGRHGLLGMRERAQLVGGELEIKSAPATGTIVNLRIPHPRDDQRSDDERVDLWPGELQSSEDLRL